MVLGVKTREEIASKLGIPIEKVQEIAKETIMVGNAFKGAMTYKIFPENTFFHTQANKIFDNPTRPNFRQPSEPNKSGFKGERAKNAEMTKEVDKDFESSTSSHSKQQTQKEKTEEKHLGAFRKKTEFFKHIL